MESTPAWIAVLGAAMLALGGCATTGPAQVRDEPALGFSGPVDAGSESRDERGATSRVRRDAYGRPIHFREIRLDRHGARRTEKGVTCSDQEDCAQDDGR